MASVRLSRFAGPTPLLAALASHGPRSARAEIIYGITASFDGAPQTLVQFDSASPATVTAVGPLTGLGPGQVAAAIDFRPATGQLYLGAGGSSAQLYTLNVNTAALTPVAPAFDPAGYGYPSFDFDPVRDELRVLTSDPGANPKTNARFNPTT